MDFKIKNMPIDKLQSHPRNYRGHPAEQIEHLKASLAEYGFVKNVIIANDNVILAGHGIVVAAREAGYKELPVHIIDMPSTDPKAQKFMVIDNEVSRGATNDNEQLVALLAEIQQFDSLTGTGYNDYELDRFIGDLAAAEFVKGAPGPEPLPDLPGYEAEEALRLIIEFDNADEVMEFCELLGLEYSENRIRYAYKECQHE